MLYAMHADDHARYCPKLAEATDCIIANELAFFVASRRSSNFVNADDVRLVAIDLALMLY